MPVGRQEALQKVYKQAQRRLAKFYISITAKEKQRIEQQKVERFVSSTAYRRVYLDREINRRIDRVRYKDEEERYNIYRESNSIIEVLEAQQRAYIPREREKQD